MQPEFKEALSKWFGPSADALFEVQKTGEPARLGPGWFYLKTCSIKFAPVDLHVRIVRKYNAECGWGTWWARARCPLTNHAM